MHPSNLAQILRYLGYEMDRDWSIGIPAGQAAPVIESWTHVDPEPSEATTNAASSSQGFAGWLAENGGDPVLTNRRIAQETHVDGSGGLSVAQRAEMAARNKRDNYLVTRIMELQAALDAMKSSTGAVQNLRDAIPSSWSPTATRPRADARQDLRDAINAGDGDT